MKTYTFTFPKNNNNSFRNSNARSYTDNLILSNLKKTAPYIAGNIDPDYKSEIIIKPKKTKRIDITINTAPKRKSLDYSKYEDFLAAMSYFSGYDKKDDFDFMLADGTPIKLFADEIQIGYDLLPLNAMTKAIYDSLSMDTKKNIIDIYIKIKK